MTKIKVHLTEKRPTDRKFHILTYPTKRFCDGKQADPQYRNANGITADEDQFCAKCLRKYKKHCARYGYQVQTIG